MAHRALALLLLLALAFVPRSAFALAQSKHRSLSMDACENAHLPYDFCDWVGAAAFNVDHDEWDVLAAHAQPELGQSRCDAANATLARVHGLGLDVAAAIASSPQSTEVLADSLGRLLHTIQDNCAHSGVPNIQHAWASLSDTCTESNDSPDVQPEALACAKEETAAVLAAFTRSLDSAGVTVSSLEGLGQSGPTLWPDRGGVCEFLKSSESWDGIDRRWDNDIVRPALASAVESALTTGDAPPDVCASGPNAIDRPVPAPQVDVSQPLMWCGAVALYCVGKADGTDASPPWEPAPSASDTSANESGGCGVAGGSRAPGGLALLALLAGLALCRRRLSARAFRP